MNRCAGFLMLVLMLALGIPPAAAQGEPYPAWSAVWDGQSRFTMLILGIDRRPDDRDRTYLNDVRSDVIMVASYDPATGRAGLLSIPRDMFFALPDSGELVRINTLLVMGEQRQPGYGPYFVLEVVQYNLGMYIDGFVAFDFQAFITLVDAVGGVTVDVKTTINDSQFPDMNYRYDPLYLRPGTYTFDGYDALRYARTRHNDSDYQRGDRQLQVVRAIRDKLRDPLVAQNLIASAPSLLAQLQGDVYTNIPLEQAIPLASGIMQLDDSGIGTGAINEYYSFAYGDMRVPDRGLMQQLLTDVFGVNYSAG